MLTVFANCRFHDDSDAEATGLDVRAGGPLGHIITLARWGDGKPVQAGDELHAYSVHQAASAIVDAGGLVELTTLTFLFHDWISGVAFPARLVVQVKDDSGRALGGWRLYDETTGDVRALSDDASMGVGQYRLLAADQGQVKVATT